MSSFLKNVPSQLIIFLIAATISACSSSTGCEGCNTGSDIPGGFPQNKQFNNAGQIRITQSGLDYLEANFETLLTMLMPSGFTFNIPPVTSGDPKVCHKGTDCTASINIQDVSINPIAPSRINLRINAIVTTSKIPFKKDMGIFPDLECDLKYRSDDSSPSTLGIISDIDLVVDASNRNRLSIVQSSMQIANFDCDDIDISGGITCDAADLFCSFFESTLLSAVKSPMESVVNDMLDTIPTGFESRYNMADFISDYVPTKATSLDTMMWAGGYAKSENNGVSVGLMGGFYAPEHNPCVPNCALTSSGCTAPPLPNISRSATLSGNIRPNNKDYHLGMGFHLDAMDYIAYGLYSSGTFCLDIDSTLTSKLNSSIFALLIPSINKLTGGNTAPISIAIRPKEPPKLTLGAGTYHQDTSGNTVIDDPLITVSAKEFSADVMILLEERWIRLFTVTGDLDLPILLFVDKNGALQPMLGDLGQVITNISVSNTDLLQEDPQTIAALFPTLLGVASSMFGSNFDPISLPSVSGVELVLSEQSIAVVDNNTLLAIFATLKMGSTTVSYDGPIDTNVDLVDIETQAEILRVNQPRNIHSRTKQNPSVELALNAISSSHEPVEYSIRIDGGFWRPWTKANRITISDPRFWLLGKHQIEVMARLEGKPRSLDSTPVHLSFDIEAPMTDDADLIPAETYQNAGGCALVSNETRSLTLIMWLLLGLFIIRKRK